MATIMSEAERHHQRSGATGSVVVVASVAWAASLACVVARDGSWPWIVARSAVVALAFGGLLGALRRGQDGGEGLDPQVAGRAPAAIAAGLVGTVVGGGIGVPHLLRSGDRVLTVAGVVALLAGLVLLVAGVGAVLARHGVAARLAGGLLATILTGLVAVTFVPAVMATNVPATHLGADTPGTYGLTFDDVSFRAADGVTLSGWYVPSSNGAALVVRHGSGSTRSATLPQAVVLARHGYGVLLVDARGHGRSDGRAMDFGWFGDADVSAAITFLVTLPDVDPGRIGVLGISMGGEEAIGAAAADSRIRAVVAEGATGRTAADDGWLSDAYGARGTVQEGIGWLRSGLADLLTSAHPPIRLIDAVRGATSTSFLLIAAGKIDDEQLVADRLAGNGMGNVSVWVVPGAGHGQGLRVDPVGWEARVTAFLGEHLVGNLDATTE